jgi:1-deoxy-D-xylulose-5-phosphate reductoisomerase
LPGLPKRIAILGSTGSIGCNALEVIEALGPGYRAIALGARRNTAALVEQARRHHPAAVAIAEEAAHDSAVRELRALGCEVHVGPQSLEQIATRPDVDLVLAAVVGAAGLPAVLAAVRAGKTLALANKESLVVAGALLMAEARSRGVTVLPVDSEHSAVFQAMRSAGTGGTKDVARVVLTASGGPFRSATREQMERATPADALKHPTWRMGDKVTIDSATLFNKTLEIIEAHWLFDLSAEKIAVVVHPESIVHSMVEFVDGSVIAQLSPPDMRTPIQYALTYPERAPGIGRRIDLSKALSLRFEPPDHERFPALRLAYDVVRRGGTLGAVLNAANEAAVEAFLAGSIRLTEISRLVEFTIGSHRLQAQPSLEDLLAADQWARQTVRRKIGGNAES